MKYYYERSGLLDSSINITYHEVFQMNNAELIPWIDSVREYIVKEWDEKGIPPTVGQNTDEIIDSFRKLRDYKIRDFIEKDDDGNENVIKNFNKFANGVNQFFPTMMKTKIGMGKESVSIYDRFADDRNLDLFRKAMGRGVRRDSMYTFSKSISLDRKENKQGGLPYWNGETATEWLKYYSENKGKFSKYRIWISKSHQEKYFKQYVCIKADDIRKLYNEGIITDEMLTNVHCPTLNGQLVLMN